ncbi:fumarylacetoacetate hydrolase family protein [Enterobacter sp. CC120223-11]|uniref:fumarylacetoacetate hydrolase family protein n=1 Tax=Enterobacter sp. CC120223-11 TaxID=1378073 RepID=UPI000BC5F34A|nr:fumarylacetoacetate hydrolase family protein [Enterobacter sp. CC120223-11]SNY73693.1 2-keto-4-pentenoate hydratase/2-oxohepta-3-ene-1,7-dioic acid hydratase (catechol pathway) [Enterobacter sp. CC120223-11]
MYQHHHWQGALLDYPVSKVVCVGSNYAKHIQEMGSATPEEPVLFIKPETALCDIRQPLVLPEGLGSVHHEVELAVLIGGTLRQASEDHVRKAIAGYGVALDLTLRDLQGKMKKAGQPWEKAKGFDNSCPISGFIPAGDFQGDPQNTSLSLKINGEVRQQGSTSDMIHKIVPLIAYMSRFFTLKSGDVILTGTPEGVGPLASGDELEVSVNGHSLSTRVL